MKVKITEYEGCYHIDFEPESLNEVATLISMQINAKKKVESFDTCVSGRAGVFSTLVIGRIKNTRYTIK